jgi:hypothetical protein
VSVAIGGFDLENALADLEDGDIEGSAAEVEYGDLLLFFLIEPIGQGGRRRFVDDAKHIETGDLSSILGGLTLAVVEIGRNRNDRIGDGFAQVLFGGGFEVGQDKRGNFGWAVLFPLNIDPDITV